MSANHPATISDVLDAQAETAGDRTFLFCDEDSISYSGLRERSLRLAGGLRSWACVVATGLPCCPRTRSSSSLRSSRATGWG